MDEPTDIYKAEYLGDFLKQLRLSAGLTLKQVAAEVGVTYNALCMIENGHNYPKFKTLLAYVRACGSELWLATAPRE